MDNRHAGSLPAGVSWLRKALGETAAEPLYLHTKRGVEVRLVDPQP